MDHLAGLRTSRRSLVLVLPERWKSKVRGMNKEEQIKRSKIDALYDHLGPVLEAPNAWQYGFKMEEIRLIFKDVDVTDAVDSNQSVQ